MRCLAKLDEPILTALAAKDHLAKRRDIASVNDSIVLLKRMGRMPRDYSANGRDLALIELLSLTGCRRSEASKLDVDDVDFERTRLTFRDTTNKDERHVPLHPRLARTMRTWIAKRSKHRLADTRALVLGRDGRLTSNGIGQALELLCRDYQVEPISPHQLRRRFAHVWAERGGRDDELMALNAWRTLAMPAMYRQELAKESRSRLRAPHV